MIEEKLAYGSTNFVFLRWWKREAWQRFSSVQFSSVAQSCLILCDPMNHSTPGLPVHHKLQSLLKLMPIELVMTSSHLILCHPLLLLPPNPSKHQGLFQWVNSSREVAKVLEFQLQHQSFQWTPRIYLLQDGLVGSPCSSRDSQESSPTPQFKSINFSVLSFLHCPTLLTTGKTIALTRWTFVGKVMSLLFNMLSRLVITFLPRSKRLLISWLQSPSAVILEPPKIKSDTVSTVSPSISHELGLYNWLFVTLPTWSLQCSVEVSLTYQLGFRRTHGHTHGLWVEPRCCGSDSVGTWKQQPEVITMGT